MMQLFSTTGALRLESVAVPMLVLILLGGLLVLIQPDFRHPGLVRAQYGQRGGSGAS